MKRIYSVPLGRLREVLDALPHPERSAYSSGPGAFSDFTIQTWSNRESMARSVRMQQRRARRSGDWKPVQPLTNGEGY
jgi:hypothetical protein